MMLPSASSIMLSTCVVLLSPVVLMYLLVAKPFPLKAIVYGP